MNASKLKITAGLQIGFGTLLLVFSIAFLFEYRSVSNVQAVQAALASYSQSVADAKQLAATTLLTGKAIADEVPKNLDDFAQAADDTASWIHYAPVPTKSTEQALHGSASTLRKTAKSIRSDLRPELDALEKSFRSSCDQTIEMLRTARESAAAGNRMMWLIGLANLCGGIVVLLNGISLLAFARTTGKVL